MTLDLMLGFVSGVLHPAQGCKILCIVCSAPFTVTNIVMQVCVCRLDKLIMRGQIR